MKRRISDLTHTIFSNSKIFLILTLTTSIVALILYFGFFYLSEHFSWDVKISYWFFFCAIASLIFILCVWFRFFSKESNSSQSNASRHHEDTNWISSHVDSDYWDPPNDYYDK
jgi:hypothetical protein